MRVAGPEESFNLVSDLVRALGYPLAPGAAPWAHVESYLEDYAEEYLWHDTSVTVLDGGEDEPGGHILLTADGVQMHSLESPFTRSGFDAYLTELDVRVGRRRVIEEISLPESESEGELPTLILQALGDLFRVSGMDIVVELGGRWDLIDAEQVGLYTYPDRYLVHCDTLVVGLDDQYVSLFPLLETVDGPQVGAVLRSFALPCDWDEPNFEMFLEWVREETRGLAPRSDQHHLHLDQVRTALTDLARDDHEEYRPGCFSISSHGIEVLVLVTAQVHPMVRFHYRVAEVQESQRTYALALLNSLQGRSSTSGVHWWLGDDHVWQLASLDAATFNREAFFDTLAVIIRIAQIRTPEVQLQLNGVGGQAEQ